MTSLTNVNFMSQDRFNTIGETSNSEMYLVEGGFFPSDKYEDLTLGATGTEYTTPADGWFVLAKAHTAAGQYITFKNPKNNVGYTFFGHNSTGTLLGSCPSLKGEPIVITYTAAGTTEAFRFVYA